MSEKTKGSVCIILSAVLFGMMPLITRILYSNGCNPYTAAFLRFLLGGTVLFLLQEKVGVSRGELVHLIGLSMFYAVFLIMLYASYLSISTGLATTLHFTYPIFVVLLSSIVFHTKITKIHIMSLFLCMAGMVLMYTPGGEMSAAGMLLALGSGLIYSIYIVLVGHSHCSHMPALKLSFWLSVFACIEIGIFLVFTHKLLLPSNAAGWGAAFLLALTANVFAFVLFQKGLGLCGGVQASLLSTFEPLTGVLIGVLILGESLTLRMVIAIACTLLSTVFLVK